MLVKSDSMPLQQVFALMLDEREFEPFDQPLTAYSEVCSCCRREAISNKLVRRPAHLKLDVIKISQLG